MKHVGNMFVTLAICSVPIWVIRHGGAALGPEGVHTIGLGLKGLVLLAFPYTLLRWGR